MKWSFSISVAILLASLASCKGFSGGLMPVFQMDSCVGDAKLIVRGYLDEKGNLDSHQFFKGGQSAQVFTEFVIVDGAKIYRSLSAAMTNSPTTFSNAIEVVAFLDSQTKDEWQPDMGYAGVAGLEGTNVYLFGRDMFMMLGGAGRDEHYNRENFLADIKEQVRLDDQLEALCALPQSAQRVQKLIAFYLEHGGWYRTRRVTEALRPISEWAQPINAEVQQVVLKAIADTNNVTDKCALLNLTGNLHLSEDAFGAIAPLIERSRPPEIRRAAMESLERIDRHKTMVLLLPLITLKEPELYSVLETLQFEDPTMDLKMADALLSLSKELRQEENQSPRPASFNDESALCAQLVRHVNLQILSFYFDWLLTSKPLSPDYVTSNIQAMLGVNWDRNKLENWWEQHQAIIEATYNLQDDAGRKQWFSAYQDADDPTRHYLVRLWMIAPETNQVALVQAATQAKTAIMAKAVIAELWNAKHLNNAGIQAMFENFMKVEFVDLSAGRTNRFKFQHDLVINLKFDYPFNYCCIGYRHPIVIDGKTNAASSSVGQICPGPTTKDFQSGGLSGYVPGISASTTLEVFQLDHWPDGKKLWSAEWKLGPIKLSEDKE